MTAHPHCRNPACRKERRRRANEPGWEGAHGYCRACLERWNDAGRPASGPPAPLPLTGRNAAWTGQLTAEREARVAEYASLRGRRYTNAQAAWRMGISVRTAQSYGRELKQRETAESEAAA